MNIWIDDTDLSVYDMDKLLMEDQRQVKKWGVQRHDPFIWMTILTEEVGELAQAILKAKFEKGAIERIATEAIQVATLALKIAKMSKEEKVTPTKKEEK